MMILKFVLKFISILNKDATPRQIAGGMVLGFIVGMTPLFSLHNLFILFLLVVLRANFSAALVAWAVSSGIGYLFDPLSNRIGFWLLTGVPALKGLWTDLYNTPVVPWTKFNNTLTLGSLVLAVILAIPLYPILVWAVVKYREKVMAAVMKWKITGIIRGSRLFGLYLRFSS